jgi:hypothetical protein
MVSIKQDCSHIHTVARLLWQDEEAEMVADIRAVLAKYNRDSKNRGRNG